MNHSHRVVIGCAFVALVSAAPVWAQSHTTGLLISKTCPGVANEGDTVNCTVTVENQDPDHGVINLVVTNAYPIPGGTPTVLQGCAAALAPNDNSAGGGADFTSCLAEETFDQPCESGSIIVQDQAVATGNDADPILIASGGFGGLPVSGSTTNGVLVRCSTPTPTSTPTDTPTSTPTDTPTDTPTPTPTDTPTETPTNTPTNTPTETPTDTPTNTPTNTPTGTPTNTPTSTVTNTSTPTSTPTDTVTATPTSSPTSTETPEDGGEGCTPGFWKQPHHFQFWVGYDPSDSFDDVFGVDAPGDLTLLEALQLGGGGYKALARHAVAALLNASNPNVASGFTEAEVIALVQEAFETEDFEDIKNIFEAANEQGCPIGQPERELDRLQRGQRKGRKG